MKTGKCALCTEQKALVRSHIIPEFFYRRIYDETNRAILISGSPLRKRVLQKGEWEYLLCETCEARLQTYESYVGNLWDKHFPLMREGNMFTMRGLDYSKFKLLHLSILWRAGVSSRPFYSEVKLGPFQEPLRIMLLTGSAGTPDQFAFFPIIQHLANQIVDTIAQPVRQKNGPFTIYKFVFGGAVWYYFVSKKPATELVKYPFFSEDGVLYFGTEDIMQSKLMLAMKERIRAFKDQ